MQSRSQHATTPATPAASGYRSKTLATWIALIGGAVGLHRFYLHGFRDWLGWLCVLPSVVGFYGVQRMRHLGADDHLAWILIPLLGLTLAIGGLTGIVYGLTPDERWNARFNPRGPNHQTGWPTILGVMASLIFGGGVLMATLAFSAQRFFEYQAESTITR